jgi:hypothetical protein
MGIQIREIDGKMTKEQFLATADSRQTSVELMEAIWQLARGDAVTAEALWNAPTDDTILDIQEIVTKNGRLEASDFFWGASGSNWAL